MTKQVQRRRGTATQHTSFTGAEGEISVNTTNKSIHVHDGVTAGGIEGARADMTNVSDGDLNSRLAGNTLSSLTITSADINGGTIDGTVIGGSTPAAGSFTTGSFTGDVSFGDNDKAIFGAGSDLQIYHDGASNHSIIAESGSGSLFIRGQGVTLQNADGSKAYFGGSGDVATAYYGTSAKLATTSTGIDVTGTVTADGLTVDGATTINSNTLEVSSTTPSIRLTETDVTDENTQFLHASGSLRIRTASDDYTTTTERMRIDHATGDISFYEDTGTTPKFFWDASTERLGIGNSSPTTALDVTGTVTADGLTVDGDIVFSDSAEIKTNNFGQSITFGTGFGGTDRMQISSGGDISFYDSAGSSQSFFWDASAEYLSVGGTTGTFAPINLIGSNGRLGLNNGNTSGGVKIQSFAATNANGYLAFEGWDKEYMRIDSSGNVGIGTSSPVSPLTVKSNASALGMGILCRSNNDFGFLQFKSTDDAETIAEISVNRTGANTGALRFSTNNGGTSSERMRIDSSGNLLVGTTSGLGRMNTSTDGAAQSGLNIYDTNTSSTNYACVNFIRNGSGVGFISTTNVATTYATSSDYRLKEDVQPMTGASARVHSLKPCNFAWKADGSRTDGFLAHEAQAVVPEAVTGEKDGEEMQAIDQSKLVPLLTAALQEALTEIDALKTRITALEG